MNNSNHETYDTHDDGTVNDEAIARAIAESEDNSSFVSPSNNSGGYSTTLPRPPQSSPADCPGHHGLELYQSSPAQRVACNICNKRIGAGNQVWSCVRCNFDSCEICYRRGNRSFASRGRVVTSSTPRTQPSTSNFSPAPPHNNPFSATSTSPSHMCMIPCIIGNITVEMLVDTGAQSSVLSMPLVGQLGLSNRLDRRYMGVAAGVGRAQIIGKLQNIVCAFGIGDVEFLMDFVVLDVRDPLVILGLDQLRKYKCLVDMENETLIFGGSGGVEVQMLPANQQHFDMRSLPNGCTLM